MTNIVENIHELIRGFGVLYLGLGGVVVGTILATSAVSTVKAKGHGLSKVGLFVGVTVVGAIVFLLGVGFLSSAIWAYVSIHVAYFIGVAMVCRCKNYVVMNLSVLIFGAGSIWLERVGDLLMAPALALLNLAFYVSLFSGIEASSRTLKESTKD